MNYTDVVNNLKIALDGEYGKDFSVFLQINYTSGSDSTFYAVSTKWRQNNETMVSKSVGTDSAMAIKRLFDIVKSKIHEEDRNRS